MVISYVLYAVDGEEGGDVLCNVTNVFVLLVFCV